LQKIKDRQITLTNYLTKIQEILKTLIPGFPNVMQSDETRHISISTTPATVSLLELPPEDIHVKKMFTCSVRVLSTLVHP
jgi:hypothetical protein